MEEKEPLKAQWIIRYNQANAAFGSLGDQKS